MTEYGVNQLYEMDWYVSCVCKKEMAYNLVFYIDITMVLAESTRVVKRGLEISDVQRLQHINIDNDKIIYKFDSWFNNAVHVKQYCSLWLKKMWLLTYELENGRCFFLILCLKLWFNLTFCIKLYTRILNQ